MVKGFARPGYFFIDSQGIIREKFFESRYRERLTGNGFIAKLFPELAQEVTSTVEAPHLQLALEQADSSGIPGTRTSLIVEVRLPPDVHVYAPGVQGYKPVKLSFDALPELTFSAPAYPAAKTLLLPAIKEQVPVFEGAFRIRQDLKIDASPAFMKSLGADGKVVTISGKLEYQACDKTVCFPPTSVPVSWRLQVLPLDVVRAPENIRHN